MIITHVVAASTNNAIGKDGQLLWHLPKDLKFFKNTTWGMPVIMGRKTFEAVGKVLPGRTNIVVTTNKDWKFEGVVKAGSLEEALELAKKENCLEIFIIGGGDIYRQTMNMANRIHLTRVHATLDGDTFYPALDDNWVLKRAVNVEADEKHIYPFTIQTWESLTNPPHVFSTQAGS